MVFLLWHWAQCHKRNTIYICLFDVWWIKMVTCLFVKTLTNWALAGLWKTGCDQKPAHSALLKISFIKRVREVLSMNWVGGSLHQLGGRSSSLIGWEVLFINRVGGSLQLTWRGCWRRGRAGQRRRAPPGTWRIFSRGPANHTLYSIQWALVYLPFNSRLNDVLISKYEKKCTYSQDLIGHCRECNGDGNKPVLLVEAGLVLEQAWCQQDEQHSNVSLTECDAHRSPGGKTHRPFQEYRQYCSQHSRKLGQSFYLRCLSCFSPLSFWTLKIEENGKGSNGASQNSDTRSLDAFRFQPILSSVLFCICVVFLCLCGVCVCLVEIRL